MNRPHVTRRRRWKLAVRNLGGMVPDPLPDSEPALLAWFRSLDGDTAARLLRSLPDDAASRVAALFRAAQRQAG